MLDFKDLSVKEVKERNEILFRHTYGKSRKVF